jgi:hypothetical protein
MDWDGDKPDKPAWGQKWCTHGCTLRAQRMATQARCKRAVRRSSAKNLSTTPAPWRMLNAMNPLAAFTMLIATAQSLVDAVGARDNVYLRPPTQRQAVAQRLVSGLRLLRAFLRRLIILIALELEWGLVDKRGEMKRPHKCQMKPTAAKLSLTCFESGKVSPWLNAGGPDFKAKLARQNEYGTNPPVYVEMANLYAQLDFLAGIAANPLAKAQRLAFHLARKRHGILMAPAGPQRIGGRWGTQVSTYFDLMALDIITKSRNRPPPLPPPRTHWPTVTAL